jgi:F-type H+-transporting ATPase subunit c
VSTSDRRGPLNPDFRPKEAIRKENHDAVPPGNLNGSINMIGYALATISPALGVAWIFASVINGTARQPEARGAMMGTAWIGFAVVEALAIIGIALAFVPLTCGSWSPCLPLAARDQSRAALAPEHPRRSSSASSSS